MPLEVGGEAGKQEQTSVNRWTLCERAANTSYIRVPYSTYYKPMGDLPYISSEPGGLIIHTELIYEFTI